MKELEAISWITGIGSFFLALVGLFLIKPIYNHYKNKTSNVINENHTGNTYNIGGDYINQKVIEHTNETLSPNLE